MAIDENTPKPPSITADVLTAYAADALDLQYTHALVQRALDVAYVELHDARAQLAERDAELAERDAELEIRRDCISIMLTRQHASEQAIARLKEQLRDCRQRRRP